MVKTLRFTLLAVLMLICGKMTAQEVSLDFSSNTDWKFPTNEQKEKASFNNNKYSVTLQGGSDGKGYAFFEISPCLVLGTKGATLTLPAFDFAVSKIEIITDYTPSQNMKQNFYVGNVPASTETTGWKGVPEGTKENFHENAYNEYAIDENYQVEGTTFTLKVTSSHYTAIKKINIYKVADGTKKSPALQFSERTVDYTLGTTFTAPTFTKKTTAKVTFTSDNEEVATVSEEGVITVTGKAVGTANITAKAEANDVYKAGTATCTINATEAAGNLAIYKKATTIESGKKYLIAGQRDNKTYYGTLISDEKISGSSAYIWSECVEGYVDELKVDTANAYTIEATAKGYTIKDCKGRYLSTTAYSNFLVDKDTRYSFTIEPQSDGTFKIAMDDRFIVLGYVERSPEVFGCIKEMKDFAKLPMLYVLSDSSTGISNVTVNKKPESNAIYNLAGQRVGKDYKGIVIINGKKMVQK